MLLVVCCVDLTTEFTRTREFLSANHQVLYEDLMQRRIVATASDQAALDTLLRQTGSRGAGGANSTSHVPIGERVAKTLVDNYAAAFKPGQDQDRHVHYDPYTDSGQVVTAAHDGIPFVSFDADCVRGGRDQDGYPKPRTKSEIRSSLKTLDARLAVLNTPQVVSRCHFNINQDNKTLK
jgi:hypothetical protein